MIQENEVYFVRLLIINILCSLLVWLISRINLFLITRELGLMYLIPSAIVYMVILLGVAYLFRANKKLDNLILGIFVTIYTINFGLLSTLVLPFCDSELDGLPTAYGILFLVLVVLISLLTIRLNYYFKKNYKWLILLGMFGFVHYFITSMTFYLNYIILYEYIYKSLFF